MLRRRLNTSNAGTIGELILGTDGGLAAAAAKCKLLLLLSCHKKDDGEEDTRGQQLDELIRAKNQAVSTEVRQAVRDLDQRYLQVDLARCEVTSWTEQVERLEKKQQISQATVFEVREAKLRQIEAKSKLVHQIVVWKIALARLKHAQGLLSWECGYSLPRECGQ